MTRNRVSTDRRTFLAGSAALGAAGLAGCTGLIGGEDDDQLIGQIGSGREGRPEPGGTPMAELPDLEGELTVYSGRGEFLVGELLDHIEGLYDDFEANIDPGGSSDLVNQILTEGEGTHADVFYTVDSGALGTLADEGRTQSLSSDTLDMIDEETFYTDDWVGTSGRARTIPYNTDALSESDMPDSIDAYADFDGQLGWAPEYGSFQGFVTSMRILEGDEATREWLEGIIDSGVAYYGNEMAVAEAVNDGELDAGFTNHYYIQRVIEGSSDPSIATNFTAGDAGATFDVAGATVIDQADDPELAENFIKHLLSSEAQEFFAVETFEYPTIEGVEPVGDLPTLEELDVPDVDPTQLSNVDETIELMREAGVDI
ncbi:extracellular solute-binding protein [Halopiger goleimassiliensis]|uniref:extracellular solute-binding protein n=1 Tax=Halopiger goleimassiliensis TaxID=1293048 RepID=UPI00067793AD|nr:extracellular solute-binding protein [Halopiger goleimassiliensis]